VRSLHVRYWVIDQRTLLKPGPRSENGPGTDIATDTETI